MRQMTRVALVLVLLLAACSQDVTSIEGFTSIVAQIVKTPEQYDGQSVTVVGFFRSQDMLNEVAPGGPPTNRLRDWVIKDNSGAMYVAASELLPFSASSQDIWRMVRVDGTIKTRDAGTNGIRAYIIPQQIQWLGTRLNYDALPANCTIAIHRFEGTEQLDHHLYIYKNRNVVVHDAKTSSHGTNKLKQTDFDKLQNTFKRAKFFDLPTTIGQVCEGCVRYYIAAVNEAKGIPHYVTVYEGSVPANLQKFIDLALEFVDETAPL
ncbi:MAG: hypothetical protein JXA89_10645 [Anaerolineae bacterium]|nr:hypothetical protein [Anaerolineae bacterium]